MSSVEEFLDLPIARAIGAFPNPPERIIGFSSQELHCEYY